MTNVELDRFSYLVNKVNSLTVGEKEKLIKAVTKLDDTHLESENSKEVPFYPYSTEIISVIKGDSEIMVFTETIEGEVSLEEIAAWLYESIED